MKMKCKAKNKNGNKCSAKPMENGYCYRHNPDITAEEKTQSSSNGGKVKQLVVSEPYPQVSLESVRDVSKFLATLINETITGAMDLRLATGLTYISNSLLKALELSQLSDKVEELENKLNNYNKNA